METRFRHGAGRPSLDFVRTLRYRGRPGEAEELPAPEAFAAWVAETGRPELAAAPTDAELSAVHAVREAIAVLLRTAQAGADTPAGDRATVNQAAASAPPAPELAAGGSLTWHADDPVAATLSWLARDALELVASPDLGRLRACANPDCRTLFVDLSRPGTRRWCSMNTCGNAAKKATFRARA